LLASCKPVEAGSDNPMVKSGFCFEPLASGFYDKYASQLVFYNEIYNTDQAIGEDYLVSYFIDNADTKQKTEALFIGHKRKPAEAITPFLAQVDISQLPSGNYNFIIEIRNRNRELQKSKSVFFQRSNPYLNASKEEIATTSGVVLEEEFVGKLNKEELEYGLRAIAMQVDKNDGDHLNQLVKEKNINAMRLYLFSFWAQENPTNPGAEYEAYMNVARKIDEKFESGFGHGFETDRGYVFMKYGAPNDVVTVETEPSAPPYEIWFYNQFPQTNQNNVKFLFYNPSLSTNGFVLLHSTARGEVNNPRWEVELYRNAPSETDGNQFIDNTRMKDNIGRQARRLFDSF
jgi:GWxTD domain-containing protein